MPGKLSLIVLESAAHIGKRVDQILSEWREGEHFLVPVECPRFSSGEGKCVIRESVRDRDVYILLDVCNTSMTYQMFGESNRMSPDDHYQVKLECETLLPENEDRLKCDLCGIPLENPFLLSSSVVASTYDMCARAFEAGWAGVCSKTICTLDIHEASPRFSALSGNDGSIVGFKNIEQLSDHSVAENMEDHVIHPVPFWAG